MKTEDYVGLVVEHKGKQHGVFAAKAGWLTLLDDENNSTKARPKDVVVVEATETKRSMASTLGRYRTTYEPSIAAGGRKSLNCGDDLAGLLSGLEPEQVIKLAELALDLEAGVLQAKYDSLNPGQKRMNAGNRIRAAIKRGDLEIDALKVAASGVVGLEGSGN